jgi:catechol 2,3-dioxygenase-like lactoylglutathione lyase family enzyme
VIRGVYEVVVRVSDLSRAEAFYRDVLGLELGLDDPNRPMSFWRVGGGEGMLVLQQEDEFPKQHFAFRVDEADLEKAQAQLEENGVKTMGPIQHDWMPAKSLYFADPDGHELEFCAPL